MSLWRPKENKTASALHLFGQAATKRTQIVPNGDGFRNESNNIVHQSMSPERRGFVSTALSPSVEADGAENGSNVGVRGRNKRGRLSDLGHLGDL